VLDEGRKASGPGCIEFVSIVGPWLALVPARINFRTSQGAVRVTICTQHPPIEKPSRSICLILSASTNVITLSVQPWYVGGISPLLFPTPALSKMITGLRAVSALMSAGSQKSIEAPKWMCITRGVPDEGLRVR